jgi:hypothetical protein
MPKRNNSRTEQLRSAVAQEAARIMSEQGIDDYLLAKRKAAERLGANDASALPKNTEIEAALVERHRLFNAASHPSTLRNLRSIALKAMQLLHDFEPRLVGPVLSGTASEHSEITLHLFAETAEAVAVKFIEQGIPHQLAERRFRYDPDRVIGYPVFRFVAGTQPIDAVVFPIDGIRQAPASPIDGRPMPRADTLSLQQLLEGSPAEMPEGPGLAIQQF